MIRRQKRRDLFAPLGQLFQARLPLLLGRDRDDILSLLRRIDLLLELDLFLIGVLDTLIRRYLTHLRADVGGLQVDLTADGAGTRPQVHRQVGLMIDWGYEFGLMLGSRERHRLLLSSRRGIGLRRVIGLVLGD